MRDPWADVEPQVLDRVWLHRFKQNQCRTPRWFTREEGVASGGAQGG